MEKIDPRQLLVQVAGILDALKIPYAVTGGMAVFVWARPRFTADIDIIVLLDLKNVEKLSGALRKLGKYGYLNKDAVIKALHRHGEFNFIDGQSGVKVDFWVLKGDDFSQGQIKRRKSKNILGKKVYFVSPEDLILNKLLWLKEGESAKQAEDIITIFKFQKKLNWEYLRNWSKKQSTSKILTGLKK